MCVKESEVPQIIKGHFNEGDIEIHIHDDNGKNKAVIVQPDIYSEVEILQMESHCDIRFISAPKMPDGSVIYALAKESKHMPYGHHLISRTIHSVVTLKVTGHLKKGAEIPHNMIITNKYYNQGHFLDSNVDLIDAELTFTKFEIKHGEELN